MATFQIFKETALPGTLVPNSIYLITASNANYVEVYVTNNVGTASRRIPTESDIQAMISASIAGISSVGVVADIAARDALTPTVNTQVLVLNATADVTVGSGAATYVWDNTNTAWVKISEAESLDVVLEWTNIQNGPTSTPAQIDAAVTGLHTHANKTQLDKINEDGDGFVNYDGDSLVLTKTIAW